MFPAMLEMQVGAMPRYHFPCADGSRIADSNGMSLPDLDTARQEAVLLHRF